jgi:hypothetical protein
MAPIWHVSYRGLEVGPELHGSYSACIILRVGGGAEAAWLLFGMYHIEGWSHNWSCMAPI